MTEFVNENTKIEVREFKGAKICYFESNSGVIDYKNVDLTNGVVFEKNKSGSNLQEIWIVLPYKSQAFEIDYIDNPYFESAKQFSITNSLDKNMPNASLLVKDSTIIGKAANGSKYHEENDCVRVSRGIPTGQGYELCPGCSPVNHSESKAVTNVLASGQDTIGGEIYLYGHWWCCQPCSEAMEKSGVSKVHLSKSWVKQFLQID